MARSTAAALAALGVAVVAACAGPAAAPPPANRRLNWFQSA